MMSQGSNAWHNGDSFEKDVSNFLISKGYSIGKMSYESLDHNKKKRPLDVYITCKDIAVECKHYKAWGSKVQNYPWDIYNAAKCIPTKDYYAVWHFQDSTGKIQKCFERAVEMAHEASQHYKKNIRVVTWKEFQSIAELGFDKKKQSIIKKAFSLFFQ